MKRDRSLRPRSLDDLRSRESERGKPYARLSSKRAGKPPTMTRDKVVSLATVEGRRAADVVVSTARGDGSARARTLPIPSESYKAWHRRGLCVVCGREGADSYHHFPPTGSGVVNDLSGFGVCGDGVAGCHGRCQRYEVPWETQERLVHEARLRFFAEASEEQIAAVAQQVARG